MTGIKRAQRSFDMVQQYLPGLILNTILEIIKEMDDPYQAGTGRHDYLPAQGHGHRLHPDGGRDEDLQEVVGYLRMHPDVVRRIELSKVPSKSTIWRAYGMIPKSYLREDHLGIVHNIVAGSLSGDSTGYSGNRFIRWFSILHGRAETKRGWIKLHSIIDITTKAILDYHIPDGYAADITSMWPYDGQAGRLTPEQ